MREIAIVGGGPAGAMCGERLASSGYAVTIYDEHLAWEKPCGGGLTHKAIKAYQDALKETISDEDKIRATKFSAFSYCLSNRPSLCRAEFEKLLLLKPDFDLEPAEAGHPSWGPSFRTVKNKQKAAAAAAAKLAPAMTNTTTTPPKK